MALRSRLAISVAVGALVAAAYATPAVADDEWGSGNDSGASQGDGGRGQGEGGGGQGEGGGGQGEGGGGQNGGGGRGEGGHDDRQFTRGRVTAGTLLLRSAPNRGSQVIRHAHKGDIVRIFCQTVGQSVQGNNRWYLLADGTWAWGSARYIDTKRPPRWC